MIYQGKHVQKRSKKTKGGKHLAKKEHHRCNLSCILKKGIACLFSVLMVCSFVVPILTANMNTQINNTTEFASGVAKEFTSNEILDETPQEEMAFLLSYEPEPVEVCSAESYSTEFSKTADYSVQPLVLYHTEDIINYEKNSCIMSRELANGDEKLGITKLEVVAEYRNGKELKMQKLEEMKNDPWTPTLDFLPYLKGDFEENVLNMARVIDVESGGSSSDKEQQMQGLVLLGRCFHPFSFSDGTGDIVDAITHPGQYPWATEDKLKTIVPDEKCLENARAVLTGDVLEELKEVTRNVEYADTSHHGYANYLTIWNEPMQVWVYFDYGY